MHNTTNIIDIIMHYINIMHKLNQKINTVSATTCKMATDPTRRHEDIVAEAVSLSRMVLVKKD